MSLVIVGLLVAPCALLAIDLPPQNVPDSGSSALLLVLGAFGVVAVRFFSAKAK